MRLRIVVLIIPRHFFNSKYSIRENRIISPGYCCASTYRALRNDIALVYSVLLHCIIARHFQFWLLLQDMIVASFIRERRAFSKTLATTPYEAKQEQSRSEEARNCAYHNASERSRRQAISISDSCIRGC